ncbi:MAG: MBL fold metallo-hydrolase [Spirulinaceae cyanobacterium]
MKRRQLIRYGGASLLAASGTILTSRLNPSQAQTGGSLSIKWLGHTCFLFSGGGMQVLVNPFKALGCTAGYQPPKVGADLVLISSFLLDEGSAEGLPGNPKVLYEAGAFEFQGKEFQGIGIDHDRKGGRQFGTNVAWRWTQAGVRILHLGGAAAPIDIEQKILIGRPDVALIPVGGGEKAYNAQEAKKAMDVLNPKLVIPTHYRTSKADANNCDIAPVDEFLTTTEGTSVSRVGSSTITVSPGNLPQNGPVIRVMSY